MSVLAPIAALPVAALVVLLLLRIPAAGRRLTAAPTADRWHTVPTPTFGGVAIFGGFAAAVGLALALDAFGTPDEAVAILGGAALLFVAGLVDDIRALNPLAKLAAQFGAAALVLSSGISVEVVDHEWLGYALAFVWLVGLTNAFNLLDNMDGLAGSLGFVSAAFFAVAAATVNPNRDIFIVAAALALACAGFLPFNLRPRRPAAVFMGDSGSQVIGFTLGALGIAASYKVAGTTVATLVLPLLVLAVPLLDTGLVTVMRLLERRPVTQGGRDHTSHRLVYRGLSERRAVLLLVAIATALGATSLTYMVLDNARVTLVGVLLTFALLLQFGTFLSEASQGETQISLPLHLRRLVEVVIDAALVAASFYAAYLLVVRGNGSVNQRHLFLVSLPIVLAVRYLTFVPFGLYRAVWRYAGARDAVLIAAAVAVSGGVAYGIVDATRDFGDFPESVFVVDALLCTVLIGAARFGERGLLSMLNSLKGSGGRRRTLLVGAGRSGRSLLRELRETPGEHVVGFLDDDPRLRGRRIHGARVLGKTADAGTVALATGASRVVVTIPNAPPEVVEAVVASCADAGVECSFLRRELTTEAPPLAHIGER